MRHFVLISIFFTEKYHWPKSSCWLKKCEHRNSVLYCSKTLDFSYLIGTAAFPALDHVIAVRTFGRHKQPREEVNVEQQTQSTRRANATRTDFLTHVEFCLICCAVFPRDCNQRFDCSSRERASHHMPYIVGEMILRVLFLEVVLKCWYMNVASQQMR